MRGVDVEPPAGTPSAHVACRRRASRPPCSLARLRARLHRSRPRFSRSAVPSACRLRADRRSAPGRRRLPAAAMQLGRRPIRARSAAACVVQRWPAVPTAPKSIARTASSGRRDGVTMIALLPPSSSSVRPSRLRHDSPTRGPCASSRSRRRAGAPIGDQRLADVAPSPITQREHRRVDAASRGTRARASFTHAIAVSGVFSDGFQIIASPHTAASARSTPTPAREN